MKEKITAIRDVNDRGVVVIKDLKIDTLTPVQAYNSMVGSGDGFLLESIPGKYSFIGKFCDKGIISIDESVNNPWDKIEMPGALKFQDDGLPPFIGGYVGYFGYDMVRGIENLPRPKKASGFPDALLGKVDTMLMFDHMRQKVSLLHTIADPGIADDAAIARASHAFSSIEESLFMNGLGIAVPGASKAKILSVSIEDSAFIDAVKKAKHYIEEGDIIQTVLSRRIKIETQADLFTTYRRLRQINPSPYLFYIKLGEITLIGSSPEDMVRLTGEVVATLPIAGTRPRGASPEEDRKLAEELIMDEKERAEHLMLLDLARNDIGKVAKPATVQVVSSFEVRFYSHVMHIVSCVQGIKKDHLNGIDVLKACFPAGTVSGAPKVRAMQIIDELEGVCRGPYAGAVGYLSFNGNIDTGIAIRTIFRNGDNTYIQAGAGIVWDSKPEMELKEIGNKLKALSVALGDVS